MTRINVVPVEELCNQHLMAEFRELTRIPGGIIWGRLKPLYPDAPVDYVLGEGHVRFFAGRCAFLYRRYGQLIAECRYRSFGIQPLPFYDWVDQLKAAGSWGDYEPTEAAIALNRQRIVNRMPTRARWTARRAPTWAKYDNQVPN